jgi:hypothetical protein
MLEVVSLNKNELDKPLILCLFTNQIVFIFGIKIFVIVVSVFLLFIEKSI